MRLTVLSISLIVLTSSFSVSIPAEFLSDSNSAKVYNFHNKKERKQFLSMNLDASHPNLLDPRVSKSEIEKVIESWTELHQKIGVYLSEKEFDWGVEKGTISMFQKIYFNKNGQIEHYLFNMLSDNISFEKQEEFANLLEAFSSMYKIDIQREDSFAQCGKTRY